MSNDGRVDFDAIRNLHLFPVGCVLTWSHDNSIGGDAVTSPLDNAIAALLADADEIREARKDR